ncbi:MAG: prepilin-type N-terminal cleavage/methylation domain-containing protein [Planctomycetota bacterium]|nr:prepilin-type N-terminal cleavage/methylation domain-containing protein [Planctomycetota bacterium]
MRMRKGFTFIELMIVIAVIAIITAIAVPNMLQGRIRANESAAAAMLRVYSGRQETFRLAKLGAIPENGAPRDEDGQPLPEGYCSNFRLLYYGRKPDPDDAGARMLLQLIPKSMADAWSAENKAVAAAIPWAGAASIGVQSALDGYFFREPADFNGESWCCAFALQAFPALSGSTGSRAFWIGPGNRVLFSNLDAPGLRGDNTGDTDIETPSTIPVPAGWSPAQ